MMRYWKAVRIPFLVVLLASATGAHAWKAGRASGIRQQIGGPGQFTTALVEWPDMQERKVVVYLNDGANGYAFWMRLAPDYRHYTHSTKVFVCENEFTDSIKVAMDRARAWCADDLEGGDTRVTGGDLKPRADDGDTGEADKDKQTHEELIRLAERAEYLELRRTVNDQAHLIQQLRDRLASSADVERR